MAEQSLTTESPEEFSLNKDRYVAERKQCQHEHLPCQLLWGHSCTIGFGLPKSNLTNDE